MNLFPGVFIMPMVLGINFLGDGLREVTDPKTRILAIQNTTR